MATVNQSGLKIGDNQTEMCGKGAARAGPARFRPVRGKAIEDEVLLKAPHRPDTHVGEGQQTAGMTSEQLARTFVRGQTKRVAELLETLVSLGQARELADGRYVRV